MREILGCEPLFQNSKSRAMVGSTIGFTSHSIHFFALVVFLSQVNHVDVDSFSMMVVY